MEFGFTESQQKLRKEIHDFIADNMPVDYNSNLIIFPMGKELEGFWRRFQNKAVERGYPTAGWPKRYGGMGFTAVEQAIVSEEMNYWGARWISGVGYSLVGPTALMVGNDEQKATWVPPIAKGEVECLQCFTEPNAGSDEANVQLRAIEDGDEWVLNGQKTFISGQVHPHWLYTLCKTKDVTPKHRGLSLIMVPGDAKGVSYRALPTMGGSPQNEVFYDEVRVPKKNLLGELHRGFYVAMTTFEFERASVPCEGRRAMEELVSFCRKEKRNGKPVIKDFKVRQFLAKRCCEETVSYLTGHYGAWRRVMREKLGPMSYESALIYRRHWQVNEGVGLMDMFGLFGMLKPESKWVKWDGQPQRAWEHKHSIHDMGSPEINKMVIATRGFGLPRIPRQFHVPISEALAGDKE